MASWIHKLFTGSTKPLRNGGRATRAETWRCPQLEWLEARLAPATLIWDGDVDASWNTNNGGDTNWVGDTLPGSDDTLVFPVNPTRPIGTLTNDTTAGNIYALQFQASGYTITGNSITLNQTTTGTSFALSDTSLAGLNQINTDLVLDDTTNTIMVSGGSLNLGGVISGGALVKTGLGTLTLPNNNTYTGTTTVIQGTLRVENSNALGTNAVTVLDGAQIQLSSPSIGPSVVVNNDLTISGTGIAGAGPLQNVDGNNTWAGAITLSVVPGFSPLTTPAGIVPINVTTAEGTLTLSGAIEQTTETGLRKIGPGELVLSNANTYTGSTYIDQGILSAQNDGALGNRTAQHTVQQIVALNPTLDPGSPSGSFTISFNGNSESVSWGATGPSAGAVLGALNTLGITSGSVSRTSVPVRTSDGSLAPANTGFTYTITFGGSLSQTALPLTASGSDGVTAGASFVANGGIDVQVSTGGILDVQANSSTDAITVGGPGTGTNGATLTGSGTVGPLTTLNGTDAIVDPGSIGNTSTGILQSAASTFDSSATFRVLLNSASGNSSPTAGTDHDQLMVNGTVNLNGATLQVDLGTSFGAAIGRSFTILTGTSVTGQFAGFSNPTPMMNPPLLQVGSSFFGVRYTATEVILDEVVPQPTITTLTIVPGVAVFGETIAFAAQVDVDVLGGGPATGGTVTFKNGTDTLGTANVNASGQAVLTVSASNLLAVGTYSQIVAFYSDSSNAFARSQSSPAKSLTVHKANTTTSLAPLTSTIMFGDLGSVAATVTALSPGAGIPTGDVQFTITGPANSTPTVSLSGQTASPSLSTLFPGMYTITAQYQGDSSFEEGTASDSVSVTVEQVDLGVALTPASVAFAAPFDFEVTLTGPAALNALPTGTATIKEGATTLATISSFTGSNGTYTGTVAYAGPNLTAGAHNLTVEYDGSADPSYNTAQTSTTLDVSKVDLALTIDPTTVAYAAPLTVKLTGNAALSTLPVGTVTVKEGGTTIGTTTTITGSSGSFTAVIPFIGDPLTPGLHSLTVAFTGNSDPNYNDAGPTSVDVTVEQVDLGIALTPASVAFAAPFDFQVTLTGPTSLNALPGGTVMIKEGATVLATISSFTGSNGLYTGSIAYAGPNLNPGSHYLTVEYDGSPDPSYNSVATSAALVVARVDVVIIPDAPAAGSTYGTPRTLTITFSEPVIGFTADDVVLGGTAGATTATVTGSGTVYTVAVSGMRQTGSISLTIPAGSVTDLLGYRNLEPATTTVCFGELVVTGAGSGGAPRVIVYDQVSRTTKFSFLAYEAGFDGGVRVATGDVNGDGTPDIITGAGPGGGPHVRIFDGVDLTLIDELFAYGDGFTGGVFVASGDVNNDGFDDVVTGAGAGGTSHVRIFGGNGAGTLGEFFAYDPGFVGGVQVAVGDVNNDGYADIITGAGAGGGPHVKVIDGTRINERQASGEIQDAALLASFYAYDPGFSGGVFVAARDVNGDGHADILTGAGPGDGPRVKLIDGTKLNEKEADGQIQDAAFLGNFLAYDSQTPTANGESPVLTSGVRVALVDTTGDGVAEILTAPGFGASLPLTVRDARTLNALDSFFVFGDFLGGEFVS